jgi:hypothetical protein
MIGCRDARHVNHTSWEVNDVDKIGRGAAMWFLSDLADFFVDNR